jgi:ribose-phosphate pyrophosphokinase
MGGEQQLLHLHQQGLLERTAAIEFSLMRQIQIGRPAEENLSVVSKSFANGQPQVSASETPADFYLDRYEWERFRNGGLAVYPAQDGFHGDGEPDIVIHKSVRETEPYLIVRLHDRSGVEDLMESSPEIAEKANPLYSNIWLSLSFLDVLAIGKSGRRNVVFPYFAFARSDRPVRREPINSSLFLRMLAAAGADDGIFIDLHAGQVRGMVDPNVMTTENLYLRPRILEYITTQLPNPRHLPIVAVGPDPAAGKLAERYANALHSLMALGYKIRNYNFTDTIDQMFLLGTVKGARALIFDDEAASGNTNELMINQCEENGVEEVYIAVSHAKLFGSAAERFSRLFDNGRGILKGVISGDTIPHSETFLRTNPWLHLIDTSDLIGQAVYHNYCGLSMSDMYANHN